MSVRLLPVSAGLGAASSPTFPDDPRRHIFRRHIRHLCTSFVELCGQVFRSFKKKKKTSCHRNTPFQVFSLYSRGELFPGLSGLCWPCDFLHNSFQRAEAYILLTSRSSVSVLHVVSFPVQTKGSSRQASFLQFPSVFSFHRKVVSFLVHVCQPIPYFELMFTCGVRPCLRSFLFFSFLAFFSGREFFQCCVLKKIHQPYIPFPSFLTSFCAH